MRSASRFGTTAACLRPAKWLIETKDPNALSALAQGLAAVAAHVEPQDAAAAATAFVQAMAPANSPNPMIPFKSNSQSNEPGSLWQTMYHYFQFRRDEFLTHYHQGSNAESTFSAIKRKFGDAVRSKSDTAMKNEVFCKFLCHNICCVIMEQCVLGIDPVFGPEAEASGSAVSTPDVLRFPAG
jgi:hypothetical protein